MAGLQPSAHRNLIINGHVTEDIAESITSVCGIETTFN